MTKATSLTAALILSELKHANAGFYSLDMKQAERDAIPRDTFGGFDPDSFIAHATTANLDRIEALHMALSFTVPANESEAVAMLAVASQVRRSASDCFADDSAMQDIMNTHLRAATRLDQSALRMLPDSHAARESILHRAKELYPWEPRAADVIESATESLELAPAKTA